jgi:hypothetical protein
MKRLLLCSLAASAVFAMAVSNADASSQKHHKGHYYGKTWAHHHGDRWGRSQGGYEQGWGRRRSIDGDLIDSAGWRLRNGNWDNTCFRTLDYLSSMSSCTGGGAS